MTAGQLDPSAMPTAELIAEAAAWVAILHGPRRTAASELGFSQWLGRSAAHARAFEEATDIWQDASNLPRPRSLRDSQRRPRIAWYAVATAIVAVVALATLYAIRDSQFSTGIGEQRLVVLDDGTRVTLNTDTRLVASYSRGSRRIQLERGEALFEVAKDADRPFIVAAGRRQVRALGTTFVVRTDRHRFAVTLVEGAIAVVDTTAETPAIAVPGQRITFTDSQPPAREVLPVANVLAWQRREVALDDTKLSDAIAEMNRYSRTPVVATLPAAADIRVTGLFRAGDSISFARAVARAYHLQVTEEPERIVIRGEEFSR
jgi:transmembrane sensor